jgi:hypothetical protein
VVAGTGWTVATQLFELGRDLSAIQWPPGAGVIEPGEMFLEIAAQTVSVRVQPIGPGVQGALHQFRGELWARPLRSAGRAVRCRSEPVGDGVRVVLLET